MIGTQVGPFTVLCPLGESGMGSAYLAEHAVLKTRRAVKFLSPQLTQDPLRVRRFVHEARAAARLHHPNLIQVHDVGQLPSGAWFILFDYLDGQTLGRFLARHAAPLPPSVIVHIVAEIGNGLELAHRHDIVHRDLTPEHVFLTVRDRDPHHAVLLDFGVARLAEEPVPGLGTLSGVAIGTPAYMPQEQLRGAKVTPAVDLFALGVIVYQMCTGGGFPYQLSESPQRYCELTATELYHRQMTRPPVDPRDRWPGLSRAWVEAILAAVHPDPARRPRSAGAFVRQLAEAVPASPERPCGLDIVRAFARELALPSLPALPLENFEHLDPVDPVDPVEPFGPVDPVDPGAAFEAVPQQRRRWAPGPLAVAGTPMPSGDLAPAVAAQVAPTIAGSRYQLGGKLGAGGMAEVFAGTMIGVEGFARRVAIKRVASGLSHVPAFATMFVSEAQIASQLAHPNIVSVLDFSRDPEDRLFLVMEYVDGKDLASVLTAGPIAPSVAIFIVVEMLRGLGYAHDLPDPVNATRGVVHRDVSPQNLLLSHEGAVKVSDFGLAKARAASDGVWSETVRGKPGYMSPEQCAGELLDGRSDLYSVGVMLWEMLAHRPLFVGTSKEILAQVMFKDVPPPTSARGVPADLAAVAMKLLARDRDARYATAELAIAALLRCGDAPRDGRGELVNLLAERFPRAAGSRPRPSHPAGAAHPPRAAQITRPDPPSTTAGAASGAIGLPVRPRRGVVVAMVAGVVAGGLAAGVMIARGDVAPAEPTVRAAEGRPAAVAAGAGAPGVKAAPTSRAPISAPARSPAAAAPLPVPHRERIVRAGRTGELAIIVKPWALIWLNGKPRGQTPFRAPVPEGHYRIRIANDDVGQDETTTITVVAGETSTIERSW